MEIRNLADELRGNRYPGRGIVLGRSDDGTHAVAAYFIMGRSENSRNRIFVATADGIRTEAYDAAKVTDPSLILYTAVRVCGTATIVSNGDHTDTIFAGLASQRTFEQSLRTRTFEPDAPHYTPRISGVIRADGGRCEYALSIVKTDGGAPDGVVRNLFSYENPPSGCGRCIYTYQGDGDPLVSYCGEPKRVAITGTLDEFTEMLWNSLHPENKVSLFVRYIDMATGGYESRIVNKNS
ncbi:MAG: IMP cyclohydrolase [Treponema sp.]|nr:IMP cyclohydrolase [Treponema sp.]